ncbi:hypothetical protein IFR05_012346 [Cadophora sp. M221]|nr:hypothetical protein IFR05_012346 [Cadophora sp. M221]
MRIPIMKGILSLLYPTILVCAYDYPFQFAPTGFWLTNQSLSYAAPKPLKYQHWFHNSRPQVKTISDGACNLSLAAYLGDATARETLGPVNSYCWTHSNCILATVNPSILQSFASASILLGLMPTILSMLGPSVAETALLSLERPLLSLLISLGAPALFPMRFLIWVDPLGAKNPKAGAWIISCNSRHWKIVLSIAQYVLAGAAVVVNFYTAWSLGVNTVLVWFCDLSYWPVLWVSLGTVTHILEVLSLRVSRLSEVSENKTRAFSSRVFFFLRREFTPTAFSKPEDFKVKISPLAVLLQYFGAIAALLHLVFGTALFSSLLYIGNQGAMSVFGRFGAAAIVSRVILHFEISGMIDQDKIQQRLIKGIVQSDGESEERDM